MRQGDRIDRRIMEILQGKLPHTHTHRRCFQPPVVLFRTLVTERERESRKQLRRAVSVPLGSVFTPHPETLRTGTEKDNLAYLAYAYNSALFVSFVSLFWMKLKSK